MRRIKYFKTVKTYLDFDIHKFNSINSYFKAKGKTNNIVIGWVQAEKFFEDIPTNIKRLVIIKYPQFKHLLK